MKAVVMAGGEGSRLRPLTIGRPKPMVPIANKPVLCHILDLLKRHGITEVVITLQYLADMVQTYFGNGHWMDMDINYAIEEVPLGTAGSVKNAQQYLNDDEPFLVISGDALTDFDLTAIINFHKSTGSMATMTLCRVPNPLEYGVIVTDAEGRITDFREKPSWGEVISDTVNTGIYVINREVLDMIPSNVSADWGQDLFPKMLAKNYPLFGYIAHGYWCDVGNLKEYMRATSDLLLGRCKLGELGTHIGGDIWTGDGVEIAPDAHLFGPIYLGAEVKIKGGVVIHGPAVIRDYTIIDNRAHIDRSIIWRNCYVGEAAELRGAIVTRQCSLKARALVFEGAVIGDNCVIGEAAVIHPNVKLWPGKEVESGATVRSSIIWGSQGRRVLFGRFGVTGVVNVDLTPEFAAKLGAAFGATIRKGGTVTINRDAHPSSRMLKRAIIAGLPSAGIHVLDLENVPIPLLRYFTRAIQADGAVHVRLSPFDQRVVDVRFMEGNGLNLSKNAERNVERIFFREDFRRAYLDDIGKIEYAQQQDKTYKDGFMRCIDANAIRRAHLHVVADFAHSPVSDILAPILTDLDVDYVPLNARIDPKKVSIAAAEFQLNLDQMAKIVGALETNLGAQFDVGGEKLFLTDEHGHPLSQPVSALAVACLAWQAKPGGIVLVPVNQTLLFEQMARSFGGIVRRAKVDLATLMRESDNENIILAVDGNGNYIFPEFQPVVDALFAFVKTLEYLATQNTTLGQIVAGLPKFYVEHGSTPCPWEAKGTVMRRLNEQYKHLEPDTTDGVKIWLNDLTWVLVLPDPDNPTFHVAAEAPSKAEARELVEKYERVVQGLQG